MAYTKNVDLLQPIDLAQRLDKIAHYLRQVSASACIPTLPLGFRLPSRRALPPLRNLDVLHLDDRPFDAPGAGGLVGDLLQDRVDLLALGEQLVELVLAEHGPQRRLRDLRRRDHEVLD